LERSAKSHGVPFFGAKKALIVFKSSGFDLSFAFRLTKEIKDADITNQFHN